MCFYFYGNKTAFTTVVKSTYLVKGTYYDFHYFLS